MSDSPGYREDALFVSRKPTTRKYGRSERNSEEFKCNRCKKVGHRAANCHAPAPMEEKEFRCYRCQKVGHKAADCCAPAPVVKETTNFTMEECAFHVINVKRCAVRWCLESGATSRMSSVGKNLESVVKVSSKLNLANNAMTTIEHMDDRRITVDDKKGGRPVILKKILHVPDLRTNLMPVSKIADNGNEVIFKKDNAYILNS